LDLFPSPLAERPGITGWQIRQAGNAAEYTGISTGPRLAAAQRKGMASTLPTENRDRFERIDADLLAEYLRIAPSCHAEGLSSESRYKSHRGGGREEWE